MPIRHEVTAPTGAPDAEFRFTGPLFKAWLADTDTTLAHAVEGTRFRASWAGSCARLMEYRLQDLPDSDPHEVSDLFRFAIGHAVHDLIQKYTTVAFPGCRSEVKGDLRPQLDGSYHGDMLVEYDNKLVAVEIKSINGFSFKAAATNFKGPPEGPRRSAVLQGALFAANEDADELVVLYISLENLGKTMKSLVRGNDAFEQSLSRFCAEWTYTADQFEAIAAEERNRLNEIINQVDNAWRLPRTIPDPDIPPDAVIDDPSNGLWVVRDAEIGGIVDSGKTWHCNYCNQQSRCVADD